MQNLPRQWIGTWNNYSPQNVDEFRIWCEMNTVYSICGHEIGESGTPHLQSFHQHEKVIRFSTFKRQFPEVHVKPVEVNNGAEKYCAKEGKLAFQFGTLINKRPGHRSDIDQAIKKVRTGANLREIADECPEAILKYPGGISRLMSIYEKPRDRNIPKDVIVLWGESESQKTRRAFDMAGENPYVWDPGMGQWFDGYAGEKTVIMDEFRGQLPLGTVLRLFDRYPMRVQYKGGSCQFVADLIIVTSPKHPSKWYKDVFDNEDTYKQLLRRLSKIEQCVCDIVS